MENNHVGITSLGLNVICERSPLLPSPDERCAKRSRSSISGHCSCWRVFPQWWFSPLLHIHQMMRFYEGVQSWNIELISHCPWLILAIKTTALSHTSPFWSNHIPIPLPHETVLVLVLVPLQLLRFSPPAQWALAAAPRLQASYSDSLAFNRETWIIACDDQGAGWIEFLSPKNFIKLGFFHLKPPWIWRFCSSDCNLIRAAIAPSSSATLTGSALLLAGCIGCRKELGLTAFQWWPPTDPNRIPNRIPFCWSFSIVSHGLTLDV